MKIISKLFQFRQKNVVFGHLESVCVCLCVCVRERDRKWKRGTKGGRERKRDYIIQTTVALCVMDEVICL